MPAVSQSATVPAGTTEILFKHQTSTSSLDAGEYYNPISRWLDVMDALDDATAKHRQRAAWFAPRKISIRPPVLPVRRYQKTFQGHLFAPGGKK